jgi:hypothetical protein
MLAPKVRKLRTSGLSRAPGYLRIWLSQSCNAFREFTMELMSPSYFTAAGQGGKVESKRERVTNRLEFIMTPKNGP